MKEGTGVGTGLTELEQISNFGSVRIEKAALKERALQKKKKKKNCSTDEQTVFEVIRHQPKALLKRCELTKTLF